MRWMLTTLMLAAPSAALAAYEHGARGGGCAHEQGCAHLAAALMAGVAALGYWVLRHADKDTGAIRWGGRAAGWVLLVTGLMGFLCGTFSHVHRAFGSRKCLHSEAKGDRFTGMMQIPPGHPPIGETPMEPVKKSR